jgi:hypothetical protein
MVVLEEPYVSGMLLDYLAASHIPVLKNDCSGRLSKQYSKLNITDEKDFITQYHGSLNPHLYTVSEYALNWVCQALPNDTLIGQILLLKNKVAFRKACRSMHPDFLFKEINYADLFQFDLSEVSLPIILKPSIGFLSAGVYTITNDSDWEKALADIQENFLKLSATFPDTVVGNTQFIIESYIQGREFAIDLYFLEEEPVIVNIFEHPFCSEKDVSDRLYTTSKALFDDYRLLFTKYISQLNTLLHLGNIPVHLELRVDNGKIVPIEINPLRFAGLCLNELHAYITGNHPLNYYLSGTQPDYANLWKGKENKTFHFTIIEKPEGAEKAKLNVKKIQREFSKILEWRTVNNPALPIHAFVFSERENSNQAEENRILHLNINDYLN